MVVSDAGPLIAFARIGRLDLLEDVLGEILVPDAVYDELVVKGRGRPGAEAIARAHWIERRSSPALLPVAGQLQAGEREAIALAVRIGAQLLIDERLGGRRRSRAASTSLGV